MQICLDIESAAIGSRVPSHILGELWEELLCERGTSWGRVVSDSMWPVIKKGDQVLVEKVPWDKVRFGDIVVFRRAGNLAVHRALGKRQMNGQWYLVEKGDALLWPGLVPAGEVVGRVLSIQSSRNTTNAISGCGRILQLALALQCYASVRSWRLVEHCLSRLGGTRYRHRCAAIYGRLCSLLRAMTLRLAFMG